MGDGTEHHYSHELGQVGAGWMANPATYPVDRQVQVFS